MLVIFCLLQALTIIAFNGIGKGHPDTFKLILSIGPTFAIMKFIESKLFASATCFHAHFS